MNIKKTPEFMEWFLAESIKSRFQIEARFKRISTYCYFGDFKNLGSKLFELRWKNGRRIYFTLDQNNCVVLLGGNKNGQVKDIKEARKILKREVTG